MPSDSGGNEKRLMIMTEKTLLILAAGLGTRFKGGIKQLSPVGPEGELLMEYSIYDAVKAGCTKAVFIIRRELEQAFREKLGLKLEKYIKVEYCFQELSDIPFSGDISGRTKPWGTVQAVLAARNVINGPFVIINADDYYGSDAFGKIFGALDESNDPRKLFMGGFVLKNTLGTAGGVSRGICETDDNGLLRSITEVYGLMRNGYGGITGEKDGCVYEADPGSIVSMNMWGFTPAVMEHFENGFRDFLRSAQKNGTLLDSEYVLPAAVDDMIKNEGFSVRVIPTDGVWLGITRSEELDGVRKRFSELAADGTYPSPLFK